MLNCTCPASTTLTTIPAVTCAENFGQIQKVAFQRLKDASGNRNSFSVTDIALESTWTSAKTATDATKVVISPYIQAPTGEAGDAITFGGGNETLGGVEIIIGRNPSSFTSVMRGIPQNVIKVMKELQCEAQAGNLGVFLFDDNGNIECVKENADCYPIPIASLFIGDKTHGGLEAPDSNALNWSFPPNYSDNLDIVKPAFNPLDL